MSNVRFHHIADQASLNLLTDRVMTIVTENEPGSDQVYFGVSVCKPSTLHIRPLGSQTGTMISREVEGDRYNRKFGNELALARLDKYKEKQGRNTMDAMGSPTSGQVTMVEGQTPFQAVLAFLEQAWTEGHIKRMLSVELDNQLVRARRKQFFNKLAEIRELPTPEERRLAIEALIGQDLPQTGDGRREDQAAE